jgi:predicted nucleic acid-binding protein
MNPNGKPRGVQAPVDNFEAERLQLTGVDWPEIYRQSERLSEQFTKEAQTRTLDILHVATAQLLGMSDFYSLDRRQRALAGQAGLRVKP